MSEGSTTVAETLQPLPRKYALALCALSGILWFFAAPTIDLWFLAWFAMVPALFVVDRADTHRRAFLWAWLVGIIGNIGGFYWIVNLLRRFAYLPLALALPLLLLLCAYQALTFGLAGWLVHRARRAGTTPLPMVLVLPLAFVSTELLLPQVFAFYVAITQAWNPRVLQIIDWGGPLAVTGTLLLVNGAIYDAVSERLLARKNSVTLPRWSAGNRSLAIAAGVLLFVLGYGQFRLQQIDRLRAAAPKLRVGLVQPNVAFDQHGADHQAFASQQLRDLQRLSRDLEQRGAQLILWTESSYPYAFPHYQTRDYPEGDPRRVREGFSVPLVFGAVTYNTRATGRARGPYNSMYLMDGDGALVERFDKMFLMMFGEYTPGRDELPFLEPFFPQNSGQFAKGTRVVTLPLRAPDGQTYRLGPMICYEDLIPGLNRQIAAQRPHLLVNITNDAWFGDSSEPWEHLALSVFRTIEQRTDLVRAVNTGVSAFVDAGGRVYHRSYSVDPKEHPVPPDTLMAQVSLLEGGHTTYAAVGDLFGWFCALATGFLSFFRPRLFRTKESETTTEASHG